MKRLARASCLLTVMIAGAYSMAADTIKVFNRPLTAFTRAEALIVRAVPDMNNGALLSSSDARTLLDMTLKKQFPHENLDDKHFYCIVNVVLWATSASGTSRVPGTPRWYIYHEGDWSDADFSLNNRIFGQKKIWMLVVHLSKTSDYTLAYQVRITKKLPANIQNLKDLASFALGPVAEAESENSNDFWAVGPIDVDNPSDVSITPQITPASGAAQKLDDKEAKFDNEGLYRWDVSFGLPVTSTKQVQFDTANNTITPKTIDRQNLTALLNFYPVPVDIKGSTFARYPFLVGGVSLQSQPLHKAIAGIGWGPAFANFYAGALILTEPRPIPGSTTLRNTHHTKFTFGLNLPVKGVLGKLGVKTK